MGLASALSTALTGLSAAETTIDVVGNNLANSNTVGFKASDVSFSTQFLQTMSLGAAPSQATGGTNPRQTGMGVMTAGITPDFKQGTIEMSSSSTDLAIQGEGFFMVEGRQGESLYTRNGQFKFNAANELVTVTGNRLLGFGVDDDFQIERTTLDSISVPLGAAAVAQSTEHVFLEGTLSPTGDLADTATIIQTGVLGSDYYSRPSTATNRVVSVAPNLLVPGEQTTAVGQTDALTPGAMTLTETYHYRFAYAEDTYVAGSAETAFSSNLSVTLAGTENSVHLGHIPKDPQVTTTGDPSPFNYVRIYRATDAGDPVFNYVGQVDLQVAPAIPANGYEFDDILADAATGAALDETRLTGNYTYYVTFADTPDPASGMAGTESRPNPIALPVNVNNGRIILTDLPSEAPLNPNGWQVRRIYRNSSTDDSLFTFVGEISNVDQDEVFIDYASDASIAGNKTIDLDGPKIAANTLLTDVVSRDGTSYNTVFGDPGTIVFTGRKGGRALEARDFEIESTSTIQDWIDFMQEAMGIQRPAGLDPDIDVPSDAISGRNPGGFVDTEGRINFVGNNGEDNAIDVGLSGILKKNNTGTLENVELPWVTVQDAVGESAVTDFIAYDSLGIPLRVRLTSILEKRDATTTTYRWMADSPDNDPVTGADISVGTGLITFDGEGNFISSTENRISIDRRNVSSASPLEFSLDFNTLSGLSTERSSLNVSRQDGSAPGVLTSFIVGEDGTIRGVFSNGITRSLGQIRLARFSNPVGLQQMGENMFAEGVNSGLPVQGDPGQQGIGGIISGAVELSNTDIGGNLIDLILASTMYRGNTRVITTAQQMIDELLSIR